MDFALSREQKDIQKTVREFVKKAFQRDAIHNLLKDHEYPYDLWQKAAELGFVGIHFPEDYSGQGLGAFENMLVCEELCRGDSSVGMCIAFADFSAEMIMRFGSEEQKKTWLPQIAEGKCLSCGAFTEPDHGSDITTVETMASKDGDSWVINGTKTFITNSGPYAGLYNVLCQTDPDAQPAHRGLSVVLVEADRPGITSTSLGTKMGLNLSHTAEVNFKDVRVPVDNLVGEENKGFYHVLEFFDESRFFVAAQALGTAQGAFDRALQYVKTRQQFGRKIGQFQAIQHKIAEMATKIKTARLLTYNAAWNFDQGRIDPELTSMAKMYAARVAVEVCDEAIQLHGGYGYMEEYDVERFYRDAKITELYEGTKEIQKNTIAQSIIGKIK